MSVLLLCYRFDAAPIDLSAWAACEHSLLSAMPPVSAAAAQRVARPGLRACVVRSPVTDATPIRVDTPEVLEIVDSAEAWPVDTEWPVHEPPLASVRVDLTASEVRLRRDRLGQAALVWVRVPGGVLIASRIAPLLAHPEVSREFDERFLAAHFGLRDPLADGTLYRYIHAVAPGATVSIVAGGESARVASFDPPDDAFGLDDRTAARRCLDMIEQSVVRCVQPARRLGILLSPGLDSSSILALLPAPWRSHRTVAVNYGTTLGDGVDERPLAAELAAHCGIRMEAFDSADHPAVIDQAHLAPDPGYPFLNPYRPVKHAVYERFERAGVDTVLTGNYGDHWALGPAQGMVDAVRGHRWDVLARGLGYVLRTHGPGGAIRDPSVRNLGRWLLRMPPRPSLPAWIDIRWREWLLEQEAASLRRFSNWPDPAHAAYNFGPFCANDSPYENHYSDRYGFRQRHPYRDWQLLRHLVALPAHMSCREGTSKWLVRQALAGRLADTWRLRPKMGDLLPLLANLEAPVHRRHFESSISYAEPVWRRFVDPQEVSRRVEAGRSGALARDYLLLVLAAFGAWCRTQGLRP